MKIHSEQEMASGGKRSNRSTYTCFDERRIIGVQFTGEYGFGPQIIRVRFEHGEGFEEISRYNHEERQRALEWYDKLCEVIKGE